MRRILLSTVVAVACSASAVTRVGIIGLDTSHSPKFAALGRGCETVCCLTSADGDIILVK